MVREDGGGHPAAYPMRQANFLFEMLACVDLFQCIAIDLGNRFIERFGVTLFRLRDARQ